MDAEQAARDYENGLRIFARWIVRHHLKKLKENQPALSPSLPDQSVMESYQNQPRGGVAVPFRKEYGTETDAGENPILTKGERTCHPSKESAKLSGCPGWARSGWGSKKDAEGRALPGTDGLLCLPGRSKKGLRRKTPRTAYHVSDQ